MYPLNIFGFHNVEVIDRYWVLGLLGCLEGASPGKAHV